MTDGLLLGALSPAAARPLAAALVVLGYAMLCAMVWRRHARPVPAPAGGVPPMLVAYASQTGTALLLAQHAAGVLALGGQPSRVVPLGQVSVADLADAQRVLFVVSTHGDGGAPDNGVAFERTVMGRTPPAAGLRVGVLALGDRRYERYCAFGRRLDDWLRDGGAQSMFERIEVDNGDEDALLRWRHEVTRLAGTVDVPDWQAPAFGRWTLVGRRVLNPGSAAAPVCLVELSPAGGPLPAWQSGDLAQLRMPQDPGRPREYSLASTPRDGVLALVVRQERHADGRLGLASGWLTHDAPLGSVVDVRLREHPVFRLGDNASRPLLLVGNGSGWAGLRGHLKALAAQGSRGHWLVFGERQSAHDGYAREEAESWLADGVLARCDLVFSRDQDERRYVQHVLRREAEAVRRWLGDGAAVYVCGSIEGMAAGVDEALREIAGSARIDALADAGRYRRDVY